MESGYPPGIAENREITESFEPIRPAGPPPDSGPPRMLMRDVWPWLALLGILAVAGLLVWLLVLRGGESKGTVVPAVVGMQQERAVAKLTNEGFGVKVIIEPADKPRGIVVSQEPGGGSRLDKGQVVTLHVSNGLPLNVVTGTDTVEATTTQSTTTTQAQAAPVPEASGQDLVSGAGQVESAGFVAETRPDESASGAPGAIVSQEPPAGTDAPIGSVVVLTVATGANRSQVEVPNVVGQKAAAARAALLEAKLTARTVYKKTPGKVGVVLAETPTGTVPAYTQVALTVGS